MFDFSFQRERGEIIASQRRLLFSGLEQRKTRRSLLQAVLIWNVEGKTRKKWKNTSSFVCVLGCWRTAAIDRTTFHACQRSGTTYCSTSDYLRKKATTLPQKHSEKRSHQDSVVTYHQFRSVVVDSSPAVADLLESASEVKHDRMLSSWRHLWTTLCVVRNKTSLCKVTAIKKKRWILLQFLASVVQVMVLEMCCLTRKQDVQGISLLCSSFEPKLMLLLFWGISIAMVRKENKSTIFHLRSRMSWLTAQQTSALASTSGCTRIKNNNVFVHLPSLFSCVSLPTQRNSTH